MISRSRARYPAASPPSSFITQLDEVINVWKIKDGQLLATASLPGLTPARLSGDTLTDYGGNGPFSISLDPNVWFKDLCRIADRDITPDEKPLYPVGAKEDRPCQ